MNAIEMFEIYKNAEFTDNFIIGGVCGDVVKFAIVKVDEIANNLTTTTGSTKARSAKTLRFLFSGDLKKMVTKNGTTLCTTEEFEQIAKEVGGSRANRGLAFEKLVTEFFGQDWTADNVPFYKGADLVVDGIAYQIKSHKATLSNEKTLAELGA